MSLGSRQALDKDLAWPQLPQAAEGHTVGPGMPPPPGVTNNVRKTLEESCKVHDLKSVNGFSEQVKALKPSAEDVRVLGIVEPAPCTIIFSFS